jgi:hypothetical protein
MSFRELFLLALAGWTALGVVGVVISLVREERQKVLQGLKWLVAAWVIYVAVVIGVSVVQPRRVMAKGQDICFDEMCFAVVGVDELPVFAGRNMADAGSKLVRVAIRVTNKARQNAESEALLRVYLVDGQGRRWEEVPGLSGNPLTARVAAGGEIVCEPVFKVASDASGLGLVYTHGRWQPGILVVGDSDSWLHKRTVVALGR